MVSALQLTAVTLMGLRFPNRSPSSCSAVSCSAPSTCFGVGPRGALKRPQSFHPPDFVLFWEPKKKCFPLPQSSLNFNNQGCLSSHVGEALSKTETATRSLVRCTALTYLPKPHIFRCLGASVSVCHFFRRTRYRSAGISQQPGVSRRSIQQHEWN